MARKYDSIDAIPDHVKAKLSKFFTNVGGKTFVIHGLPPELTGGALARYSRAPTGMQLTLVNEFLDENGNPSDKLGSELMDRVLNQYGDDSVGELEGTHVGIEDVSQLVTKTIEDRRIGGSPIEQSTRYVRYDSKDPQGRWRFLRPQELKGTKLEKKFEDVNNQAFDVYAKGIGLLQGLFEKQLPRSEFSIEVTRNGSKVKADESSLVSDEERKAHRTAYNFAIRCAALDMGRCVLPSSTLTHLGIYGNGRFFTNLLTTMKSGELAEEKQRAAELETELAKVIPTFIKRNKVDGVTKENRSQLEHIAHKLFHKVQPEADRVTLVRPSADYLDNVIAYSLFPFTNASLQQITHKIASMGTESKKTIFELCVGQRYSRRDRSGRGLEAGYPLTFDLVGGFAEYRDLQRHRMVTQQRQRLTPDLGFIMPGEIEEVGLGKEVLAVEEAMRDLNSDLRHAGNEAVAQYATLFNHRVRFAMGMNLREFQHLAELRTQTVGHPSYRSMVMEMAHAVRDKYSWAGKAIGYVNYTDPDNKISRAKEQSRIAGGNLAKGIVGDHDLV